MAITIQQIESAPAPTGYPSAPDDLSTAAEALREDMVWPRIESYIAYRYSTRDVVWIVEGPGEWHPPLSPATISTVEVWSSAGEYETATLDASPLGGYWLPCTGPFRFTASVGADKDTTLPPATVLEAYRRLAEYMAAKPGTPGARSESVSAGSITISNSRSASWIAQALQNSGAADLLRNYRHV